MIARYGQRFASTAANQPFGAGSKVFPDQTMTLRGGALCTAGVVLQEDKGCKLSKG